MSRSVKEITKTLGTNKNVVYRIIEKLELAPVPNENPKAPKEYSDDDFLLIKKEYQKLQIKHDNFTPELKDNSELIVMLQNQIKKDENEIQRLNETIAGKDALIKDLTDKLAETVKASHLETVRYQELLAREQNTKLLLTAQAQSRFNLFKPSTWKRNKAVNIPDFEPLTKDEPDEKI